MRYCLIESEYYPRQQLRQMIAGLRPDYELAGEAEDTVGLAECLKRNPDLVVAGVELSDGYAHKALKRLHCRIPVILYSAYYQYGRETEPLNTMAYILKPVSEPELQDAIETFEKSYSNK